MRTEVLITAAQRQLDTDGVIRSDLYVALTDAGINPDNLEPITEENPIDES